MMSRDLEKREEKRILTEIDDSIQAGKTCFCVEAPKHCLDAFYKAIASIKNSDKSIKVISISRFADGHAMDGIAMLERLPAVNS